MVQTAASAVAKTGADQFQDGSRWLVREDLQMTAQPASSAGKGEEFRKRRRVGDQSGMQDGSFPMPRARRKDLTWAGRPYHGAGDYYPKQEK